MNNILKTETDNTLATRIFSLVPIDVHTSVVYDYETDPKYSPMTDGISRLAETDTVISHTQHCRTVVRTPGEVDIPDDRFVDTFSACRRLFDDISRADGRGHGVSA